MTEKFDINLLPLNRQDGLDQTYLPGVYVAAAPPRAARSRKNDRLIMYLSFENQLAPSKEQMTKLFKKLEDGYYAQSGTVTSSMKTIVQELNELLLNQNLSRSGSGQQMIGYLYLLVIRGNHLYLAQSGPVHGLLLSRDSMEHYYDPQTAGRGLGLSRSAGIRFFQTELTNGMIFVMAPKVPASWNESTLKNAFGQSLNTLQRRFLSDAGLEVKGLVLQAVSGKGQVKLIQDDLEVKPAQAASQPRSQRTRLSLLQVIQKTRASKQQPKPQGWEQIPLEESDSVAVESDRAEPVIYTSSLNPGVDPPTAVEGQPALEQPTPSGKSIPPLVLKAGQLFARGLRWIMRETQRFLKRALPGGDDSLSTSALAFVAVAVPLIVVAVAAVVYVQIGKSQQYDLYYGQAQVAAQAALAEPDPNKARIAWELVISNLNIAENYYSTPETQALRQQTQIVLDQMDGIQRLVFQPVIAGSLSRNVKITRIIATQRDLFLMDIQSGNVMRAWKTGTGYEIDPEFRCGPGQYGALIVGKVIDIAEYPQPIQDNSKIFALDENGTLLICGEDTSPLAILLNPPDSNWGNPKAIVYQNANIYVLDPLTNAVWIYFGLGSGLPEFPDPPTLFFVEEVPSLQTAVDIAINRDDLYILYDDGHIVTCQYSNLPEAPTRCTDPAVYVDNRPGYESSPYLAGANLAHIFYSQPPEPSLYFLDPLARSFYHFTLRLNLVQQFQPQPDLEPGLATALAISSTRSVFMAIGNQVYQAFLP